VWTGLNKEVTIIIIFADLVERLPDQLPPPSLKRFARNCHALLKCDPF